MTSDSARAESPDRTAANTLVVIGPFPPPMHGMAHVTAIMTEQLRSRCNLYIADISARSLEKGLRYHATRVAKIFRAAAMLLRYTGVKGAGLYMPAAAGAGMYYTTILTILARILRYRIFIHHHSFAYIDRQMHRMALLARCAGAGATHIFLCADMERRYRSHYPWARQYMLLSNAWNIVSAESPPARPDSFLVLGHLSNLGPEKGFYDVLDTFRGMLARKKRVRLVLAGPPTTPKIRKDIEAAMEEFGDALDYRGPVFGGDKDKFYRDIDVFLFPSQNEGQPCVIFEAMSYGVPSIAYARGCMQGDLARGGGISVPVHQSFVDAALPVIAEWAMSRDKLRKASSQALERLRELRKQADVEFKLMIDSLTLRNQNHDS